LERRRLGSSSIRTGKASSFATVLLLMTHPPVNMKRRESPPFQKPQMFPFGVFKLLRFLFLFSRCWLYWFCCFYRFCFCCNSWLFHACCWGCWIWLIVHSISFVSTSFEVQGYWISVFPQSYLKNRIHSYINEPVFYTFAFYVYYFRDLESLFPSKANRLAITHSLGVKIFLKNAFR